MAKSGGNSKISSKLQKEHYKTYKLENKSRKNKIKKLERHCKRFPTDETAKKNLERIKKDGYKCRTKPLIPGSNRPVYFTYNFNAGEIQHPQTAGEQLSNLLGIPLPVIKTTKKKKPKITHKKAKNVQRP